MSLSTRHSLPPEVLRTPLHWLPFSLGADLLPVAPGTRGSLKTMDVRIACRNRLPRWYPDRDSNAGPSA